MDRGSTMAGLTPAVFVGREDGMTQGCFRVWPASGLRSIGQCQVCGAAYLQGRQEWHRQKGHDLVGRWPVGGGQE